MSQKFAKISAKLEQFIKQQHIFFVGTATADSKINISPKGMDSLRVINKNRVVWLNVTGSGNETSAHIQQNSRMTIMFTAFEGQPMILRLYGTAQVIHKNDPQWQDLYCLFQPISGARQIFDVDINLVQTSCGMAVPLYDFVEERQQLTNWAIKKGAEGIQRYWQQNNQQSLDGEPTNILDKNT
ncbi:MAG: pyridoxamine 5'-phosphate oxidase [Methylophaga sp.]|nr:MAG: pyridoxamine 5'-phosphate oxidase [Methylophaga sp.]